MTSTPRILPGKPANSAGVNDRRLTGAILLQRRTFDRVRWREILHDIQRHLAEQVYSSTGSRVGKLLDGAA